MRARSHGHCHCQAATPHTPSTPATRTSTQQHPSGGWMASALCPGAGWLGATTDSQGSSSNLYKLLVPTTPIPSTQGRHTRQILSIHVSFPFLSITSVTLNLFTATCAPRTQVPQTTIKSLLHVLSRSGHSSSPSQTSWRRPSLLDRLAIEPLTSHESPVYLLQQRRLSGNSRPVTYPLSLHLLLDQYVRLLLPSPTQWNLSAALDGHSSYR